MKKRVALAVTLLIFLTFATSTALADESQEDAQQSAYEMTAIMGQASSTPESMFEILMRRNNPDGLNPVSEEYAKAFVIITIQEAGTEGVRADVAFALMMHETGYLNFGGDVLPQQNNFGGLGATGGGEQGASFEDTRIGVRAVVQHLKCYGSNTPLANDVVDPRWNDWLRTKAVYVQHLGVEDNPYGTGWAKPGKGYGEKILSIVEAMDCTDTSATAVIAIPAFDPGMPDQYAQIPAQDNGSKPGDNANSSFPSRLMVFNFQNIISFTCAFLAFSAICIILMLKQTKERRRQGAKTRRRRDNRRSY